MEEKIRSAARLGLDHRRFGCDRIIGSATTKKTTIAKSTPPATTAPPSTAAPTTPTPSTTISVATTPATTSAEATTAAPAPPTTSSTSNSPTITAPARTTTSNPVIDNGVYLVNTELAPGLYRVGQFWERLDANGSVIDNDLTSGCPTIVNVLPTDDHITIDGKAIAVSPQQSYDPIARGCSNGTFLVGLDIQPGRYKVTPDTGQTSYWARLDKNFAIIDNDVGQGKQLILTIKNGDFAIKIEGSLTPG